MKIKTILTSAGLAWCASLGAAPLSVSTAVQSQPDASAPVIAVLAAGTEQPPASATTAPAGWTAVDLPGPFTGYVHNRDLDKQLDVAPGASIFLAPKDDAGLLAVYAKGDKAEITGLRGGWTQIRLEKTLTGYISSAPAVSAAAAPVAPPAPAPAAPALPAVASSSSPAPQGQAAPPARLFEGKLASSESLLYPHRPFKWQLNDASGDRIAYVNLEGILMTEQIENYVGHTVVVLGSLRPVKETRDLVIDVEAFHLK